MFFSWLLVGLKQSLIGLSCSKFILRSQLKPLTHRLRPRLFYPYFPAPFFRLRQVGWGKHLTETFEPFLVANYEVFSFLCAPQWSCYMRDGLVVNPCPTRTLTNPPRIVHAVIFQPQVELANADAYTVSLPHFSGGQAPSGHCYCVVRAFECRPLNSVAEMRQFDLPNMPLADLTALSVTW